MSSRIKEAVLDGDGLKRRTVSIAEAAALILPRGHAIHGYSQSIGRMLMVLETSTYSDDAPLLGFGVDGSAERALARALITYGIREQEGLTHITESQLPESTAGSVNMGRNVSRFDNIVWGGDFKLFQDGEEVVAASAYGGGYGMSPLEVRAPDPMSALVELTERYQFMNRTVRELPSLSFE